MHVDSKPHGSIFVFCLNQNLNDFVRVQVTCILVALILIFKSWAGAKHLHFWGDLNQYLKDSF